MSGTNWATLTAPTWKDEPVTPYTWNAMATTVELAPDDATQLTGKEESEIPALPQRAKVDNDPPGHLFDPAPSSPT